MQSRQKLKFATTIFLSEMRRQAVVAGSDVKIGNIEDYPPEQRSMLMSAIEKAIKAVDPAADQAFQSWREKQKDLSAK